MKISIITIVYNDKNHIGQTIESILNQSARQEIEYIIVDGMSTDGTSEIIRGYGDKVDKYICEPDKGIYDAMNKGLAAAAGDYVMFINSGDKLHASTTIEEIIAAIGAKMPKVAYGHYCEWDGSKCSSYIPCRKPDKIWYGPVAAHQSMVYSLPHIRTHGLAYDLSYRIAADYKFTAQAIKHAESDVMPMDIYVADFDITGVSSTNQNAGLREANRVRKEVFGWNKASIALITAALLGARYTKRYLRPIYNLLRH